MIYGFDDDKRKQPITGMIPVGTIQMYAGANAPDGWLLCQGQAISRTDYAELFSILGTLYGGGDGGTTFNLPNMGGRVPVGKGSNIANTTNYWGDFPAETTTFPTLGERGGHVTPVVPRHYHSVNPFNTGSGGAHRAIFYLRRGAGSGYDSGAGGANVTVTPRNGASWDNQWGHSANVQKIDQYTINIQNHFHSVPSHSTQNTGEADVRKAAPMQPYMVLNYIIFTGVITA